MNEELQKVLAELIGSTIEAKDFLLSELPDVINQLLWWHGVRSGLSMTIFLLGWAFCVKLSVSLHRSFKQDEKIFYQNQIPFAIYVVCMCIWIVISPFLFSLDWLQILVAPKLYLIEYAAKLVG